MQQQLSILSLKSIPSIRKQSCKQNEKKYLLAKSMDNCSELKKEFLTTSYQMPIKNIFNDPIKLEMFKHDQSVGPRIQNNKIVPRSIVGKPELFKRRQAYFALQERDSTTRRSMIKGTGGNTFRNNVIQQNQTNTICGQDLEKQVSKIQQRLFQVRLQEEQEIMKLPFQKKLIQLKQTRALNEYQRLEKEQNKILELTSKQVNRDLNQSLMVDLYRFGRKQEYNKTNDSMHFHSENKTYDILEIQNENGLPQFALNRNYKIIRKPIVLRNDDISNRSRIKSLDDSKLFNTISSNNYIKFKSTQYSKLASEKMTIDIDDLLVVGQSKLDHEINFDVNHKYLLKDIEQGSQKNDEIIDENYAAQYKINYK